MSEKTPIRRLLRALVPLRLRNAIHPYSSVRDSLRYPAEETGNPLGAVWIFSSEPGSELVACAGTIYRWSRAGANIRIGWIGDDWEKEELAPLVHSAEMLGVEACEVLSVGDIGDRLASSRPAAVMLATPFVREGPEVVVAEEVLRCSGQSPVIYLHEGGRPIVPNRAVDLRDDEQHARSNALRHWSDSGAKAAEGFAEYRAFVSRFRAGQSEAYLRISSPELKRLLRQFAER